jgi:hypothetical protein
MKHEMMKNKKNTVKKVMKKVHKMKHMKKESMMGHDGHLDMLANRRMK